jgi:inner membrane protein
MASIGHVAVGLCAARARSSRWREWIGWPAVALVADLDIIGFRLGVPFAGQLGHRGASHSIVTAILLAVALGLIARRAQVGLVAFVVALSHPLLDALTDGGNGVALFWPLSTVRFFLPWRPIPVSPIGVRLLSARGVHVMLVELVLFAPAFLWALWPRRRAAQPLGQTEGVTQTPGASQPFLQQT